MKIMTKELEMFGNVKNLTINFFGTLSTKENVSFNATYDKDGKLIHCSAPYSSTDCPDYYIEVATYFQKMKEIQGQKIIEIANQLEEKTIPIKEKLSSDYSTLKFLMDEKHENEINRKKILTSLKKSKRQEKINQLKEQLKLLDKELSILNKKEENINNNDEELRCELRKIQKIEIIL